MMRKAGIVVKRGGGEGSSKLDDDMPSCSEPNDIFYLDEVLKAKSEGGPVSGVGYTSEAINAFISKMVNDDWELELPKLPYDQAWSEMENDDWELEMSKLPYDQARSSQIENPLIGPESFNDLLEEVESQLESCDETRGQCVVDFSMLGDNGGSNVFAVDDDGDSLYLLDLAM